MRSRETTQIKRTACVGPSAETPAGFRISLNFAAQMINNGIVILNIDQNYSQIIIGAVIVLAVLLHRINGTLCEKRLARAGRGNWRNRHSEQSMSRDREVGRPSANRQRTLNLLR